MPVFNNKTYKKLLKAYKKRITFPPRSVVSKSLSFSDLSDYQ